jgi:hypothetical protein
MKSLFVVVLLVFSSEALADWDEWRGPTRNDVVKGFDLSEEWPEELEMVWKKKAGFGYASGSLSVFITRRRVECSASMRLQATGCG